MVSIVSSVFYIRKDENWFRLWFFIFATESSLGKHLNLSTILSLHQLRTLLVSKVVRYCSLSKIRAQTAGKNWKRIFKSFFSFFSRYNYSGNLYQELNLQIVLFDRKDLFYLQQFWRCRKLKKAEMPKPAFNNWLLPSSDFWMRHPTRPSSPPVHRRQLYRNLFVFLEYWKPKNSKDAIICSWFCLLYPSISFLTTTRVQCQKSSIFVQNL